MDYDLYHTVKLRKILRCLGFIPEKLSARDRNIIYIHPEKESSNKFIKYISIPRVRVQNRFFAMKIINEIKYFGFTNKDIERCC